MTRTFGRSIGKVIGGLVVALGVIAIVFVAGMRAKSPPVLDTVRRSSRAMKPLVLRTAGTPGNPTSVVRHVGRATGRSFETPVGAVATDDGFVIALPYGANTDWLKNVLASGSASIVADGTTHAVDRPQVVPMSAVAASFPPGDQRAHRVFKVEQCLQVRRVADPG